MNFRWENKSNPKIAVEEIKNEEKSSSPRMSPVLKYKDIPEPLSPAPREIITKLSSKDEKSLKDKIIKEEKLVEKSLKEDKHSKWSPREDKQNKKDKRKERDNKNKDMYHERHFNSERIIIGGEDAIKSNGDMKGRLPHEVVSQFDGRSREVNTFYNYYYYFH